MIQFILSRLSDGTEALSVFVPGQDPLPMTSTHPNFDTVLDIARDPDAEVEDIRDLFDVGRAILRGFEDGPLTARIAVANDTLTLDGEPIHNSITDQVFAFLDAGSPDWKPLARFIEKIEANPNEHSRSQLYDWLSSARSVDGALTIAPDGDVIGYKGVNRDLTSKHAGPAIVDGERVLGHVPNNPGSVIEMARDDVNHDPAVGCSRGLHIGTWGYASGWGPTVLKVKFSPSDVVSVPTDCSAQKVRVCRYEVVEPISEKLSGPLDYTPEDDFDLDGEAGDPDLWY